MNYEIFKEVVKEKFLDYIPNSQDMQLNVHSVSKRNTSLDALCVVPKHQETYNGNIIPVIYINNMYTEYLETENLDQVIKKAASFILNANKKLEDGAISSQDIESIFQNMSYEQPQRRQHRGR